MLTPAQQKVKQELEELQAAGRLYHRSQPEVHASQPYSYKKKVLPLIGILLIFLLVVLYLLHPQRSETVTYLVKEQHLYRQSEKLLNEALNGQTMNYQDAQMKQIELWKKLSVLDSPARFQDHKLDLLHVMEQQQEVLIEIAAGKNRNSVPFNQNMIELHVREELAFDSLRSALKREKFKYETFKDGTIHYWVHSKIYTY
ncbi:hypothetical protein V7266_04445 [Neobacillus drentensis]|uniref:hypothetical protein n=1 Tax=Neobacillus drentensis TaxID=220684 RepID=UPI002FFEC275